MARRLDADDEDARYSTRALATATRSALAQAPAVRFAIDCATKSVRPGVSPFKLVPVCSVMEHMLSTGLTDAHPTSPARRSATSTSSAVLLHVGPQSAHLASQHEHRAMRVNLKQEAVALVVVVSARSQAGRGAAAARMECRRFHYNPLRRPLGQSSAVLYG